MMSTLQVCAFRRCAKRFLKAWPIDACTCYVDIHDVCTCCVDNCDVYTWCVDICDVYTCYVDICNVYTWCVDTNCVNTRPWLC